MDMNESFAFRDVLTTVLIIYIKISLNFGFEPMQPWG